MDFITEARDNYLAVIKRYADYKGRAARKEYWMFFLVNVIIGIILQIVGGSVGMGDTISNLYSLAVLLPGICVAIRRMHDVGKSGWFILIPFYNLYLLCTDSQKGVNAYGPNPKESRVIESV